MRIMQRAAAAAAAATVASALVIGTAAPASSATLIQGCANTPMSVAPVSVAKTCASLSDTAHLNVWVEGQNLNTPIELRGDTTYVMNGVAIPITVGVGTQRNATTNAWEAYARLVAPIPMGPWAMPVDVANDGSRLGVDMDFSRAFGLGRSTAQPRVGANAAVRVQMKVGNTWSAPVTISLNQTTAPTTRPTTTTTTTTTRPAPTTTRPTAGQRPNGRPFYQVRATRASRVAAAAAAAQH